MFVLALQTHTASFFCTVTCTEPFERRANLDLKDRREYISKMKWVRNEEDCMSLCLNDDKCTMVFLLNAAPDWFECYPLPHLPEEEEIHFQKVLPDQHDRLIAYRPKGCSPR